MKICFKCNVAKPLEEFYAHSEMADGRLGKCKDCTKRDVRKNYRDKPEQFSAYERSRRDLPHRVKARAEYAASEHGKAVGNRLKRKWTKNNPEKKNASIAINNAVRDGRLFKPDCCSVCGIGGRIEGHHEDYSKPLEVIWLCKKHHEQADEKRRERENTCPVSKKLPSRSSPAESTSYPSRPSRSVAH